MQLKKFLSVIMAVAMLTAVIPLGTFTASAETVSGSCGIYGRTNVTWSYNISTYTLTISGTGAMNEYNDGSLITTAPWREYYESIKTVVIDYGVTSIGDYAFYGCRELTSITIPDSVTSIGYSALSGSSGGSWYSRQPDGLVYAGKVAYKYKGTCPSSVIIKDGTLGIAKSAFYGCTGLTSITIPNSVKTIDGSAFCGCTGLTSITIPDSVTSIGVRAFGGCTGLTEITIPDSVTSVNDSTFEGCTGLTSVTIGNSVTSIRQDAFYHCAGLTSITIPDTVMSIGEYAFSGCTGLKSVSIPDGVTSIGYGVFARCTSMTSVTFGNSLASIEPDAFEFCSGIESIVVNNGNSVYHSSGNCVIETERKTLILGCKKSVIPTDGSVTSIGGCAFFGRSGLKSIIIPDSITSIGSGAFDYCTGLRDVFYMGTTQQKANISIDIKSGGHNAPLTNANWHCITNINYKSATCTEAGYTGDMGWAGYDVVFSYGEEIPALGHDYVARVIKPTCIEVGYTVHTCSRCEYSCIDNYTDALDHDFGEWFVTTKPTCTEKGVETRICSRDNTHIETRNIDSLVHNYVSIVTEPTCIKGGFTTYICSYCGDSYIDGYTAALNHSHTEIRGAFAATCTENGYTGDTYCLDCGERIATGESISALGHKYNAVTTPPTCTEQGYTTYTCENCGDSYIDDYINATGHTVGEWVKDTEKHWHICSACGEKLDEDNHTESDWITDSEALPGVAGLRHKECTVCGYITETEIIPALPTHTPGDINNDGEVDNKDLTRLFQYLSNWEVEVNEAALDVNGDGSVDNKDLTRLFQYLSNWEVEIY